MAKTRSDYIEINKKSRAVICRALTAAADRISNVEQKDMLRKTEAELLNADPIGTETGTKAASEVDSEIIEMIQHLHEQLRINSHSTNVTAYIDRISGLVSRRKSYN